jgi:glycogen debranching enzyme
MGYYIRAKLYWSKQQDDPLVVKQTIKHVTKCLTSHIQLLNSTDWKGLPEVTNANGHTSPYSCYVQAWCSATLIEAFS